MVTAKIIEYDTTMTRLKVKILTDTGEILTCFVDDKISSKLFSMEYTTEYHNFNIISSDNFWWIINVIL